MLRKPNSIKASEDKNTDVKANNLSASEQFTTTVIAGMILGGINFGLGMGFRVVQLSEEVKTSQKTRATTDTNQFFLYAMAARLGRAMNYGVAKNACATNKEEITGFVTGQVEESDTRGKRKSSNLSTTELVETTALFQLADSAFTPFSNQAAWDTNATLKKDFIRPNPITLKQKFHASTTTGLTRFVKGSPFVAGLLVQDRLKEKLPKDLSDQGKEVAVSVGIGLGISPVDTGLTNAHAVQQSSVNPETCKSPSLPKLVKEHGYGIFKPTPRTLVAGIAHDSLLQFLIPKVTKNVEEHVTPKVIHSCESALKAATPTLERGFDEREESNTLDPARRFGL